jgi:hypothetical protein
MYKMYDYDKNQVPYCNVKKFKKSIFWEFWTIDKNGPHWIHFIILTFISEINRHFRGLCKIWNKIISFDMKKKCET